MNNLLMLWLSLSLSGSMIALFILILKPMLRRFSKTWSYYIWLLVILRMLIPFSPDSSIVGSLIQETETQRTATYPSAESKEMTNHLNFAETSSLPYATNQHLENKDPLNSSALYLFRSFAEDHIFGAAWLMIAICLLLRKLFAYVQFIRTLTEDSTICADDTLSAVLRRTCITMGIKKQIHIYTNTFVRAPMLIGFFKPAVILPGQSFDETELTYIFKHELIHYQRMDVLYKWLVEITVCLHWFNPMVYWVRKQINQACELSCDETIISNMDKRERKIYGDILLKTIVPNNQRRTDTVELSLNKDGRLIQERLHAIMQYQTKSKFVILLTVVTTSVLLCGTVFAGAYTIETTDLNVNSAESLIRIHHKEIAPNGKISLGPKHLAVDTEGQVLCTWSGKAPLTVVCISSSGDETPYTVENGKVTTFQIDADGEYTIAIKNENADKVRNVSGSITFQQKDSLNHIRGPLPLSSLQSVVYQSVEMRRYEGERGHPYIHDVKLNETAKKIIGNQCGMLAFDKDGNPLKIDWWSLDTEMDSTYFYLHEGSNKIEPNGIDDQFGGWSLNFFGEDLLVDRIAYVLYCDKEITFEDGTIWENPEFDAWRATYEGNKIDVDILENYYPYVQDIV